MLTVIIKDDGEDKVTQLTYENIWREIKDIPGSELLISESWFDYLPRIKNKYISLVESDCMVSEGYFSKQMKEIKTNPGRKISMLTSKTAVNYWHNCFYGYYINYDLGNDIVPNNTKKSTAAYPIQVGYMPGAVIRTPMLRKALQNIGSSDKNDLVALSTELSLAFWRQGKDGVTKKIQNGNPVYVNPNVTYVTTETYVNDIGKFNFNTKDLESKFVKESI